MKSTLNPYITNRGGRICPPQNPAAGDPRATVRRGTDLRCGK